MISMQKNNVSASILIWAIFLSLIISIGFISISTKIHKTVQSNIDFQENIQHSFSWTTNTSEVIEYQSKYNIFTSLKKWENKNISFSGSSLSNISINILSGWPIALSFNNNTNIITENMSFSWSDNNTQINVSDLWGYTLLELNSSAEIIENDKKFIIWKKIWNQLLIKKYSEITNN